MIYTRYGSRVTVVADCGLHCPSGSKFEARLLKVNLELYNGKKKYHIYRFADFMKADGGPIEIVQAMQTVPELTLIGDDLANAIETAN